jgi:uncharacterized membrane protein YhaH (DUF805 family)
MHNDRPEVTMSLLKLLFGLTLPVSRRIYLTVGVILAIVKYMVDAALVYFSAGEFWTPWAYLSPSLFIRAEAVGTSAPPSLLWIMALYALPFAWVGLSMSVRRAADAGLSPWWGIGFLVPVLNWLVIAALAVFPTRGVWSRDEATPVPVDLRNVIISVAGGVVLMMAMVAVSVFVLGTYGWSLFFATPFVVGVVCGYITNRTGRRALAPTIWTACTAIAVSGLAVLLFALEGIICILMASPLALGMAAAGSVIGRLIAATKGTSRPDTTLIGIVACLPFIAGAEQLATNQPLFEVATAVEIDASPMEVWHHVIHFSELPEPARWIQRTGIAYPIRAELIGEGVGAVRHCEFSTGPFVEPITAWEPGVRLAFDVTEQPLPMKEWSPYNHIHPPHLDGYLRSKRGEFRLIALSDGRTRLEGSTWYEIDMQPRRYWQLYSSALIQLIHLRVLNHVKAEAEGQSSR